MTDPSNGPLRFVIWLLVPLVLLIGAAVWFALDPGFERDRRTSEPVASIILEENRH